MIISYIYFKFHSKLSLWYQLSNLPTVKIIFILTIEKCVSLRTQKKNNSIFRKNVDPPALPNNSPPLPHHTHKMAVPLQQWHCLGEGCDSNVKALAALHLWGGGGASLGHWRQRGVSGGGALAAALMPLLMLILCSAFDTYFSLLGLHCLAQLGLLGSHCSARMDFLDGVLLRGC